MSGFNPSKKPEASIVQQETEGPNHQAEVQHPEHAALKPHVDESPPPQSGHAERLNRSPDELIALLEKELEKSEEKNFPHQLTAKTSEVVQITNSPGWLLQRYGFVKYRFLLPVYKLLRLPPYNRPGDNLQPAQTRDANGGSASPLIDHDFRRHDEELNHEAEALSATLSDLIELKARAGNQTDQPGERAEQLRQFQAPLTEQAQELFAARDQLLDLKEQLRQRDEILAQAEAQVTRAAKMFDRIYNLSEGRLHSKLREIDQMVQRWGRYRTKLHQRFVAPGGEAIRKVFDASAPLAAEVNSLAATKKGLTYTAQTSLDSFLASNSTIEFPAAAKPELSIILVLFNRAELTLQCLYSILRSNVSSFEVVIIDNASSDKTPLLLKQIRGAQIIKNDTNLQFLRAVNQAGAVARGKYVLLLNNDAQLMAGTISSALQTLNSADDIGAVGGKIILPDGTLQEAGSLIWQDGSCLGYGRGDSPSAPAYMFKRDVDYCSGAFLLTRSDLFLPEGFDEDYAPAYYEETDYCVRLWRKGKRVVYDPNAIVLHYEFASSTHQSDAINLQIKHREVFYRKHTDWLQSQQPPDLKNILAARSHAQEDQLRILFLDDRVPHSTLGSGFPRSNRILWELVKLGHAVTFYPSNFPSEDWADVYRDVPSEVEVMLDHGQEKLREFLSARNNYYDVIIVSRPHNMVPFKALIEETPGICGEAKIVYDAEARIPYRDIEQSRLEGKELSPEEQAQLIKTEVSLVGNCDCIVSVSDRESSEFLKYGCEQVYTLGHAIEVVDTESNFEERRDLLFVGAIHSVTSPNADSMIWFCDKVLPLVQKGLGYEIKLNIAGLSSPEFRQRITNKSVHFLGPVDDLSPLYKRARLFLAPTRFSAGIPLKVCEAAAYGLPTVATSLTGLQLGWSNEKELLLADDPRSFADACVRLYSDGELWNRLRANMIARVKDEFSAARFSERLKLILE